MVKAAEEAGVGIITDLVNQIIVEGVIPAETELSTIVCCYKEKEDSLEKGNCRGLNLTDQILQIAERDNVDEKLTREHVDLDQMQFVRILNYKRHFYFETVAGEIFNQFLDLEKGFD